MIWLRLRLASDASQILQLRQALLARLTKLDRAVAIALRVAKDNPAVLRAQIDALRLSGKLGEARTLAPKLSSASDEPETSYVLAALDIADESPSWLGVIERLRPAAASEHGFGRARAALTYALIRAERFADARAELNKVKPDAFQLTLFAAAESYLGGQDRDHVAAASPPAPPIAVPPPSPEVPSAAEPGTVAAVAFEAGKQTRSEAARARAKGDIEGATRLYQQVVERSPNDADALTNLGELAAQRRDFTSAMQYFQKVEDMNPNYLPALNGIADIQWLNGEKGRAVALYQRVLDSAGASSSYGAHAKIRIDEYQRKSAADDEDMISSGGEQGAESPETDPMDSLEPQQ
jgi:tetratricopeptide (TPR) repeat protein